VPVGPEGSRVAASTITSAPPLTLWVPLVHAATRKTLAHPDVGRVTLDCDVLTVHGTDLRLVIYTAEPGSPDAAPLDLIGVLGLQAV
jgi:MmyB-like transcription regulator ligand binding domain